MGHGRAVLQRSLYIVVVTEFLERFDISGDAVFGLARHERFLTHLLVRCAQICAAGSAFAFVEISEKDRFRCPDDPIARYSPRLPW